MNVRILSGIHGAQEAMGTTVIIDVLRAATVAAYLLDRGVETIVPVATQEEAFAYKKSDPTLILVGEDKGMKISGFDIGNSPLEVKNAKNLAGKHVVQRSSTGTQGLVNVHQATTIIFGSFVTASAICNFIRRTKPDEVSLVSMGSDEDELCAEFLRNQLLDKGTLKMSEIVERLEKSPDCQWFLDPNKALFAREDFYLSLELDTFAFFPLMQNDKIVRSRAEVSVSP